MRYVGLVIDADVRREMRPEQIIAMHIAADLKAMGIKGAKVTVIRQEIFKESVAK